MAVVCACVLVYMHMCCTTTNVPAFTRKKLEDNEVDKANEADKGQRDTHKKGGGQTSQEEQWPSKNQLQ